MYKEIIIILLALLTGLLIEYFMQKDKKNRRDTQTITEGMFLHVYNTLVKKIKYPKSKIYISKDAKKLIFIYGQFHFLVLTLEYIKRNKIEFGVQIACESHKDGYEEEHKEMLKMLKQIEKRTENPAEYLALITCIFEDLEVNKFKKYTRKIPKDML